MNLRNSRVYTAPVPKMPPGLVELMEGLARDVLKNNPTDVYSFCADHMQKLLQIRSGLTSKKPPTLEQKIAIATKKIQERAAQRRKEFDKNFRLNNDQIDKKYDENIVNAEQYIKSNIVKISENDLVGNKEHEIIARVDSLITENGSSDTQADDIKNASSKNDLHELSIDKEIEIQKETPESKVTKSIDDIQSIEDCTNSNNNQKLVEDIIANEEKETKNLDKELSLSSIENEHLDSNGDNNISLANRHLDNEDQNVFADKPIDNAILDSNEGLEKIDNLDFDESKVDIVSNYPGTDETIAKDLNIEVDIAEVEKQENKTIALSSNGSACEDMRENNSDLAEPKHTDPQLLNEENYGENHIIYKQPDDVEKIHYSESHAHANNSSMDLETAAITIQKVFRSFLFRNKTSSIDDVTNVDMNFLIEDKEKKDDEGISNITITKDRRGISRMDTVLQTVNEEKSLSLSTDDSSTLSSAATIIQAHVRGFLVRNKFNINKTISSTSGIDSDAQSFTSLEGDNDTRKNKTVLNIHIVPEGGHYMSRDESMLTSIDLSLDGSPPSSTNLHPLGYDKNVRRKQLKREDAIQSVSPPSNNSGKLSEDVDSVKELLLNGDSESKSDDNHLINEASSKINALDNDNVETMINDTAKNQEVEKIDPDKIVNKSEDLSVLRQMASDEMDVVTPFESSEESMTPDPNIKLIHSGECHDIVLPTKVSRSDTSVVREFQNVLVYFLLWNNS